MSVMNVNLSNIGYNLEKIKENLNFTTYILAMVKANAYGLGDVQICEYLESKNIKHFGVACLKEAMHLRRNGIKSYILVTSQFTPNDIADIVDNNIAVSVSQLDFLDKLNEYALQKNAKVNIHIKVESGMSRLGFTLDSLKESLTKILSYSALSIDGIYTHLSSADSDKDYTIKQIEIFKEAMKIANSLNIAPKYIHALSSAGIINFPEYQFNMVRVGDILYGYHPSKEIREKIDLKPSASIEAPIIHIQNLHEGTKIGYNGTYTLTRDSKVATVQLGYADGLFRSLSNKYEVMINGVKCKIIGNICMDMFMVDITDAENVKLFDSATIIGFDDSIYTMAEIIGTIDYEILSKISTRVERNYIV